MFLEWDRNTASSFALHKQQRTSIKNSPRSFRTRRFSLRTIIVSGWGRGGGSWEGGDGEVAETRIAFNWLMHFRNWAPLSSAPPSPPSSNFRSRKGKQISEGELGSREVPYYRSLWLRRHVAFEYSPCSSLSCALPVCPIIFGCYSGKSDLF